MSTQKVWIPWETNDIIWGANDYQWNEVFYLIQVGAALGSGARGLILDDTETWKSVDRELEEKGFSEEQRKRFFEIVIRVNGLSKTHSRSIKQLQRSIKASHIKKTLHGFVPITVQVQTKKKS